MEIKLITLNSINKTYLLRKDNNYGFISGENFSLTFKSKCITEEAKINKKSNILNNLISQLLTLESFGGFGQDLKSQALSYAKGYATEQLMKNEKIASTVAKVQEAAKPITDNMGKINEVKSNIDQAKTVTKTIRKRF